MKIFVIASNIPYRQDKQSGITAVHIQSYEFINSLLTQGYSIVLQIIFNIYHGETLSRQDLTELAYLKTRGVEILDIVYSEDFYPPANRRLMNKVFSRLKSCFSIKVPLPDYYPAIVLADLIGKRIDKKNCDFIFTIASPEGLAATYKYRAIPTVAFQGDIDFKPALVSLKNYYIFTKNIFDFLFKTIVFPVKLLWILQYRRAHIKLMRDVEVIANATDCNVGFYRKHTLNRSFFIGTVWRVPEKDTEVEMFQFKKPIKIIGHAGNLNATGSTYGLRFLLKELVPELTKIMKNLDYQIHIIGGGKPAPGLEPLLKQEKVVVRGFVKDLDEELFQSDIFLFLNNFGPHLAAYSRHMIAWSMKLCLVCHSNSKKTIPQIEHKKNALLGKNSKELAEAIFQAATNRNLNIKVRRGGYDTFQKYFSPDVFMKTITAEAAIVLKERAAKIAGVQ
ncbi:MAG: glycosyltransferase family 4 protein [Candidatus Omnitrophica bacterium]|nr:glycosyltransferase family 4 protein [Candidatus Omnitrophota bacterium]